MFKLEYIIMMNFGEKQFQKMYIHIIIQIQIIKTPSNSKYLLNIYDGWKKENIKGRYAISNDTIDTTYTTVSYIISKVIDNF